TTVLILVCTVQLSARGLAQSISFTGKDVPMAKVFHAIEEQTGFGVIMERSILEASKPVTLDLHNASIDEVFKICFSFQPQKMKYAISGRTIIVSVAEQTQKVVEEAPSNVIGTVHGENGSLLDGATVEIPQLKVRGQTNERGEFAMKDIPNG